MNGRRFITELGGLDANVKPRACFVVSGQVSRESMVSEISNVTFFSKPLDTEQFTSQLRKLFQPSKPEVKTTKNKVDIEFINPFIDATLKVLSITAGIAAKKEEVFIRKSDQISGDISALIAMNSQEYLGSFAVSFSEKCFLSVVNSMLGENYTAITAEIQDAAAEVCNQIFGMAKKILNENGHTIQPAIPSVISGKSHSIKHTIGGVCIGVKFSTPAGPFQVEAVIKEK
jgi:chemotaxis protein CheX